jgi:hypothetical protein
MVSWKEKARQRLKEWKQGDTFRLAEGENVFRILPNKRGLEHPPYIEFRIHRNVGPDQGFVRCGIDMDGNGDCWLCKKLEELSKSKDPARRLQAKAAAAREQMLVQVAPYDPETGQFGKPKPWWIPTGGPRSLAVTILSLLASSKRSYDDPVKGYNITIERTGQGPRNTRYGTPIPDDEPTRVPKEILAQMRYLEDYVPAYDPEEQKAVFYGRTRTTDETEEYEDQYPTEYESESEDDSVYEPESEEPDYGSDEEELETMGEDEEVEPEGSDGSFPDDSEDATDEPPKPKSTKPIPKHRSRY